MKGFIGISRISFLYKRHKKEIKNYIMDLKEAQVLYKNHPYW